MSESHDPPPGGDENRGYEILIVLIVTFIAALVPVCLRVWVRLRMAGSLGWDDYSIIGAMFIGVIGLIFNIPSVTNGFGRHTYYLTHQQIINARMWNELSQLQNIAGVWLVKISICVFLLRILGVAHRNFTNFLYALMAISTAVNLSLVFVWFFQCRPIQAIWNFTIEEKTCMPGSAIVGVAYLSAGFNMATDIICATFPIFFLRNIQINRGRKIALMVLTGFGLLTSLAALLKIIFLNTLIQSTDPTWAAVNVTICAIVEEYAGIFCAALPALKPLFSKALHLTLPGYSSGKSGGSNNTRPSFARGYVPGGYGVGLDRFQGQAKATVTSGPDEDGDRDEEILLAEGRLGMGSGGIKATTAYEVSVHTCREEDVGALPQYGYNKGQLGGHSDAELV